MPQEAAMRRVLACAFVIPKIFARRPAIAWSCSVGCSQARCKRSSAHVRLQTGKKRFQDGRATRCAGGDHPVQLY